MKRIYIIIFVLLVLFGGCELKQLEPSLPTWSVDWFVPLEKFDYTMSEAVNDSTIFADSTNYEYPILTINIADSSDKEYLSPSDLAIKPGDKHTSGGVGDVVIDSNTVESRKIGPGELLGINLEEREGQTITIPRITVTPANVQLRFDHIKSVRVRQGSLRLVVENQSFISYRSNLRIQIRDSMGTDIGVARFTDPIPAYSRRSSQPLDLAGREITGTFNLTMQIPLAGTEHLVTSEDLDDYTLVIGHMSDLYIDEGLIAVEKFTIKDSIAVGEQDDQIIEGTIRTGNTQLTVENRMNLDGILTLRLLNFFEENGSVFEKDIAIFANQSKTETLILDDLLVKNLKGDDSIIEHFKIAAVVRPDEEFEVSNSDSIVVIMASDSIFFKEVYGILAPRKFDFDPVEKNDILETQDIDGQVRLNDFEMVFDIYNSLGVDNMLLTLDMKGYKKDKAGTELDTIRLEFTGNNTFAISPGENGTPVRSTLILDKSNSNIVDFMAFLPTDIELWGITTLGGDGKVSHVSLEHAVWANYSIYSPLFLEIPSDIFVTSDMSTIDTDDEVRNNIENINYVNLQMEVVNGLPIGADLAVHISTDSLDLFSDAISDPTEKIIIEGIASPAAEVNENGYVLEPVWDKENHIRLDEEQMKIFQNEILYVGTKMRLGQTTGVVKFRTSDMIQSNGFIKVNYQMNSEE